MSLPGNALPGDLMPGGPIEPDTFAGAIDTSQIIDELLPSLHAANRADLAPEWSEADLIQWLDESVKKLARTALVFVGRSTAILTVPGQPTYPLPADHISTVHVTYNTAGIRGSSHIELEGRDTGYRTAAGTPLSWYEDLLGLDTIGLAPVPDAEEPLPIIYQGMPPTLDAGKHNTLLQAPGPVKGYLAMSILGEAYGREGEMEMPDIAQHCRGRLQLYEQLLTTYYGKAL